MKNLIPLILFSLCINCLILMFFNIWFLIGAIFFASTGWFILVIINDNEHDVDLDKYMTEED